MLSLIESGEVFAPERLGHPSIVFAGGQIGKVGTVDKAALLAFDPECEVIDASGCWVIPGLIDPHQNLLRDSLSCGSSKAEAKVASRFDEGIRASAGVDLCHAYHAQ